MPPAYRDPAGTQTHQHLHSGLKINLLLVSRGWVGLAPISFCARLLVPPNLQDVVEVLADGGHVVRPLKQPLAVELPACLPP